LSTASARVPGETWMSPSRSQQVPSSTSVSSELPVAKSPGTFFRLPWVSWQAPKALKTDMKGPALMGLFADIATGNSDETDVLDGTCCDLEGDIQVSPGTRAEAVDKLLNGD